MARQPRVSVSILKSVVEQFDAQAEMLDLPTSTYIARIVLGAIRGGSATRLALVDEGLGLPTTRQSPPGVEWVPEHNIGFRGRGHDGPRSTRWLSENGYVLERHGPIGGQSNETNQGWTLIAPDGTRFELEERRRPKAQREAERIMRRQAVEPDDIDAPGHVRPFHRHTRAVLPEGQTDGHAHPGGGEPHTHQGGAPWSACG